MENKAQKQIYNWAELQFTGFNNHCNTALRKVAPPGRSFDGVDSEGTLQAGHVGLHFSANQIRGLIVEGKL